jgi:hypothetical protein
MRDETRWRQMVTGEVQFCDEEGEWEGMF